ncbi:MAG: site-2 protease family protein [Acidobacteria bacterium]|nr:site-2 protease family protein [Acidobacteriota bacterium]
MKWSWKIAKLAGIDVYVHATFLLLLGWVAVAHRSSGRAALEGVAFTLAIFACVLLHELGHALAARRFGIPTRDITLLPIGGVARLARMPKEPARELVVALAGPAVNVVISVGLFAWLAATGGWAPLAQLGVAGGPFLERLAIANAGLALFNLIPAFPMDGGRILRALVALRTDYARATRIASRIGQGMAILFGIAGLFGNPMLLFIALFIWMGAASENRAAQFEAAARGMRSVTVFKVHRVRQPGSPVGARTLSMLRRARYASPLPRSGWRPAAG